MENNMQIFQNEAFGEIRTLLIDGEPWFAGKDVAGALGYSNASKAVMTYVDAEDKQFIMVGWADSHHGNVPIGQTKTAFVNEPGLYSLVLGSRKPEAKAFKRWITHEVIPAIRKHGAYISPNAEAVQVTPTIEQYIASARIIATCRADRLRMVIGLLDKVGISMPMDTSTNFKVERVNTAVLQTNIRRVKDSNHMKRDEVLKRLSDATDIPFGTMLTYYYKTVSAPVEKVKAILEALDRIGAEEMSVVTC